MQSHGDEVLTLSATAVDRWESHSKSLRSDFLSGFDDGFIGRAAPRPKMSEVYSQGYNDGYAFAQMLDHYSEEASRV